MLSSMQTVFAPGHHPGPKTPGGVAMTAGRGALLSEKPRDSLVQRFMFSAGVGLGVALLKLWIRTIKVELLNPEVEREYMDTGRPCLLVTWHRAWLGGVMYMGPRWHPAVMASMSRDGEWVARFEKKMGCHPMRGSSSRGGMSAQKAMVRFVKQGGRVATNVADGPRGPRYEAKAGMISLAQLTGAPLIPVIWSGANPWVLRRSWDKTMIPKPWSKVVVLYGQPITVSRRLSREERESHRQDLENQLMRITREADRLCGYQDPA